MKLEVGLGRRVVGPWFASDEQPVKLWLLCSHLLEDPFVVVCKARFPRWGDGADNGGRHSTASVKVRGFLARRAAMISASGVKYSTRPSAMLIVYQPGGEPGGMTHVSFTSRKWVGIGPAGSFAAM